MTAPDRTPSVSASTPRPVVPREPSPLTARTSARLDETIHDAVLDDGLRVAVVCKPGYRRKVALLTCDYGSVDAEVQLEGEDAPRRLPDGIAHFLEHKLFEDEAGDVFDHFARLGAQANAYTTHHETGYHVSTTERFEDCLARLLDFVTVARFTPESVEKERKVIAQEIRMGDDEPDGRLHKALLRALYHGHPVRDEVAGTVESIAAIDLPLLERCHRTFYRPDNLSLVVVGDVDPARVVELVAGRPRTVDAAPRPPVRRVRYDEPRSVASARVEERMAVAAPRVLVGWKDDPAPLGTAGLRHTLETALLLELLFGRSTAFFESRYAQHLIDGSFAHAWDTGRSGCAHALVGGETPDPDALVAALDERIAEARRGGFSHEEFARLRNKAYGLFVRSWNQVEQVAGQVSSARSAGWDVLSYLDVIESIGEADVLGRLALLEDPSRRALSIVRPL